MNKEFKEKIKQLIDNNIHLFYNGTGNPEAFKLCVKHISAAPSFSLAVETNGFIHPFDTLYIVDFENETIIETENPIEKTPLKFLP